MLFKMKSNLFSKFLLGRLPNRHLSTTLSCQQHAVGQQVSRTNTEIDDGPQQVWSNKMEFIEPSKIAQVPMFRLLHQDGQLAGSIDDLNLKPEKIVSLYRSMLQLNTMDVVMFSTHRQGRISFYMTNFGEEAAQLGSAAALDDADWIYAQYREAGLLLYRGMSIELMLSQCFGNELDLGKGRQMPIHYGNKALNHVTISSPLATQMPQASGTAYSLKLSGSKNVVACYFGEGAASEGDAHAAMNFASVLKCPVLFFCRNNGYAISTPTKEQYAGDGLVHRALGYGMGAIRVDGNDLFAVFKATETARRLSVEEERPFLIEAMTYRLGHHSTSDDSSAYRSAQEVSERQKSDNPLERVKRFLIARKLWSEELEEECRKEARQQVLNALSKTEKVKKLPVTSMFEDVYAGQMPANLQRQRDDLKKHLEKFGQHYPIDEHRGI